MRPSGFRGRSHASITEIELVVMIEFLAGLGWGIGCEGAEAGSVWLSYQQTVRSEMKRLIRKVWYFGVPGDLRVRAGEICRILCALKCPKWRSKIFALHRCGAV